MRYFYWLRIKKSNHSHSELSLGYLEDAKFYLESKASLIDISSIASFKLFLIVWLREYCTFSDSSNLLRFVRARVHVRANDAKVVGSTVGLRSAIPRNHLNRLKLVYL